MKYILILLSLAMLTISCEDVIDVDLNTIPPKLVVDASIEWQKETSGKNQQIILSESSDYINGEYIPVTEAVVIVTKLNTQEVIPFVHLANGVYETNNFLPEIGADYELKITYNGEQYQAREQLISVSEITRTEQGTEVGFDGDNIIRFDVFTNDVANVENFYYVKFFREQDEFPELLVVNDEFTDGNEMNFILLQFERSEDQDEDNLQSGDNVYVELIGVSENYANYIELVIEQSIGRGGPFTSTPVEIIGNIRNLSNSNERAFGYFRLSEKDSIQETIN